VREARIHRASVPGGDLTCSRPYFVLQSPRARNARAR
jgi:hypothetical protein